MNPSHDGNRSGRVQGFPLPSFRYPFTEPKSVTLLPAYVVILAIKKCSNLLMACNWSHSKKNRRHRHPSVIGV